MRVLSFKTKILLLVIVPLFLVSLSLIFLSIYQTKKLGSENAEAFSSLMFELRRSELKNYTEVSLTTVKDIYNNKNLGKANDFQEAADNIINNLDYVGDDFFFVYDYKSVIDDLGLSVGDIEAQLNKNIIGTFRITAIVVLAFAVLVGFIVARFTISEGKLADDKLQRLSRKAVVVQEEERGRVAGDLQKVVSRALVVVRNKLQFLAKDSVFQKENKRNDFLKSMVVLDKTIKEIHRISGELRPKVLDEIGLYAAVEALSIETSEKYSVQISFKKMGDNARLRSEVETSLYRIVQEAIKNIVTHSRALTANIRFSQSHALLKLTIQDQGAGFNVHEVMNKNSGKGGVGLFDMRVRAESLGGTISFFSTEDMGTVIRIEVPV
ncbi:MAG: ATP-binding protein [Cellvibrionaceae bacterium]